MLVMGRSLRSDSSFFVQLVLGGKSKRVDSAKFEIGRIGHCTFDGSGAAGTARIRLVTSYLVVHKGQTPSNCYCKMDHQTADSYHQWRRAPCYKLSDEHG
jgi:hypothetical protein